MVDCQAVLKAYLSLLIMNLRHHCALCIISQVVSSPLGSGTEKGNHRFWANIE